MILTTTITLALFLPQRPVDAGAVPTASLQPFVEVPGIHEFSGRLIARPRQRAALEATGRSRLQAFSSRAEARRMLSEYPIVRHVPQTDESILRVPEGQDEYELASKLMASGLFEYVEPDWIVFPSVATGSQVSGTERSRLPGADGVTPERFVRCPDDPLFDQQWHHGTDRMDSCAAWERSTGDPAIAIGICDTGIRATHEDLQRNVLEGYNAVDRLWESEGGNVSPVHFHGTRTTGTAVAFGGNGLGVAGAAWGVSHRMLRVSNVSDGGAFLSDLQHAARTSIESGDRIANLSYHGAWLASNPATAAYIRSLGGIMIWGAGNTSANLSHADRDSDEMIVVGATDADDTLGFYSAYGRFVDMVAPGTGIWTTGSGHDAEYVSPYGTSYACPLTSAACALVWSLRPQLSPTDVQRIVKLSADDLGDPGIDDQFGYGRLNLARALTLSGTAIPTADFAAPVASGISPLQVTFRDLSGGVPTSWLWDFGDGQTSTEQNPTHTYTTSGAFSVSLMVSNDLGSHEVQRADYILVDIIPPIADFAASVTEGLAPLSVQFSDTSTGGIPSTWFWDFGDGVTSSLPNPGHTFLSSGLHTVELTVSNAYGSDTLVKTDYITVDFIPPVAGFSALPTSGSSPFVVQFTDESTAGVATNWLWFFGDGYSSTLQHPAHTYTAAGTYTVQLTASNAYGSDTLVQPALIDVGPGPALIAEFSGTPLEGTAPLTVEFTDLSLGHITDWQWNFGDETTSSEQNPTHVFLTPGEYDVALEVGDATGANANQEKQAYVIVK